MASKTEKDKNKALQDKFQAILSQMLREEDNKFCVDCDTKGPRWASWNLGIFLCIRCAGIHRNLGVHVSRVKSVNLDSWTAEQVAMMKEMGNSRARAVYEANLPDNYRRPLTDSGLEAFIRQKYEDKKYIAREWIPPTLDVKSLQLDDVDVTPRGASASRKSRQRPVSTIETTQARPRLSADSRQASVTAPVDPPQGQGQGRTAAPNADLLGSIDAATPSAAAAHNNSADLLGISFASSVNISNDSQQPPATGGQSQASWPPQPEVDLFGEGSSSEQQRKMDKDNIMKLYASAPAPAGPMYMMQQQPQMYGVNLMQGPMGMQQMAYGPPSSAMIGGWGGAMQAAPPVHPMTMMPMQMQHPSAVPAATNYNFVPGTFGQPHYYQQASSMPHAYGAQASPMTLPNRYAVGPMTNGAMMSNQAPPYSTGHTLSTNLWQ